MVGFNVDGYITDRDFSNGFSVPIPDLGNNFMWGMILLSVNFIAIYGEHYDWWQSSEIRVATGILITLLLLNIYRASFIRHPFISLKTFKFRVVYLSFFVYLLVDFFISPSHLIEPIYFEEILKYDALHTIKLNLVGFLGIATGAMFSYFYFAKAKHSFKSTFLIGFTCLLIYLCLMYFKIDSNTNQSVIALAIFFRNFGYVIIAIVLLTSLTKVPFPNFFQSVSIQAFVSAASGSAIVSAILHHIFSHTIAKNFQLLSIGMDSVEAKILNYNVGQLYFLLKDQVLLVTFKEIYGILLILGIVSFIICVCYKYPYLPIKTLYPKSRTIRKMIKRISINKASV